MITMETQASPGHHCPGRRPGSARQPGKPGIAARLPHPPAPGPSAGEPNLALTTTCRARSDRRLGEAKPTPSGLSSIQITELDEPRVKGTD